MDLVACSLSAHIQECIHSLKKKAAQFHLCILQFLFLAAAFSLGRFLSKLKQHVKIFLWCQGEILLVICFERHRAEVLVYMYTHHPHFGLP